MKLNAKKLRIAMARNECSPRRLAELVGVSHGAINNYLSGKRNPKEEMLGKIAHALNVDPETLVD